MRLLKLSTENVLNSIRLLHHGPAIWKPIGYDIYWHTSEEDCCLTQSTYWGAQLSNMFVRFRIIDFLSNNEELTGVIYEFTFWDQFDYLHPYKVPYDVKNVWTFETNELIDVPDYYPIATSYCADIADSAFSETDLQQQIGFFEPTLPYLKACREEITEMARKYQSVMNGYQLILAKNASAFHMFVQGKL